MKFGKKKSKDESEESTRDPAVVARSIAQEIATNPESERWRGPKNAEANFSGLEEEFGKTGPAQLYAEFARIASETFPAKYRDDVGVANVLAFFKCENSFNVIHKRHLVPDSPEADAYRKLGIGLEGIASELRSNVHTIQACAWIQTLVTAAHMNNEELLQELSLSISDYRDEAERVYRILTIIKLVVQIRVVHEVDERVHRTAPKLGESGNS